MAAGGASAHASRSLDRHRPRSAGDGTRHGKGSGAYEALVSLTTFWLLLASFNSAYLLQIVWVAGLFALRIYSNVLVLVYMLCLIRPV